MWAWCHPIVARCRNSCWQTARAARERGNEKAIKPAQVMMRSEAGDRRFAGESVSFLNTLYATCRGRTGSGFGVEGRNCGVEGGQRLTSEPPPNVLVVFAFPGWTPL